MGQDQGWYRDPFGEHNGYIFLSDGQLQCDADYGKPQLDEQKKMLLALEKRVTQPIRNKPPDSGTQCSEEEKKNLRTDQSCGFARFDYCVRIAKIPDSHCDRVTKPFRCACNGGMTYEKTKEQCVPCGESESAKGVKKKQADEDKKKAEKNQTPPLDNVQKKKPANEGGGGQSLTGKCCSCANGSYSYSLSGTCSKCAATTKVVDATPECSDSKKSDIQHCLKKCGQILKTKEGESLTGKCCSCADGSYSYSLSGTCSKCTATSKVVDATPECLDSKKADTQACLKKCGQTLGIKKRAHP